MANRIPPFHSASPPPLHPESPPPFCETDDLEDDIDGNNDFRNFSDTVAEIETIQLSRTDQRNESSKTKCSTEELNAHEVLFENSNNVSEFKDEMKSCGSLCFEEKIAHNIVNKISDDNDDLSSEPVLKPSDIEITQTNSKLLEQITNNREQNITLPEIGTSSKTSERNSKNVNDLEENTTDIESMTTFQTYNSIPETNLSAKINYESNLMAEETLAKKALSLNLELKNNHVDLNLESSDDSSPVINESAFITGDMQINTNNETFIDDFQEFVNCEVEMPGNMDNDLFFNNTSSFVDHIPLDNIDNRGNDSLFSSTFDYKIPDVNNGSEVMKTKSKSDGWIAVPTVTIDSIQEVDSSLSDIHPKLPIFMTDAEPDDDDEFSDFVSPVTCASTISNVVSNQVQSLTPELVDGETMLSIPKNSNGSSATYNNTENWTDIFAYNGESGIELNLNTIENKLNGSSVWCKIKHVESSPALRYNWNESETNTMLLTTLSIDSRNILFGPRWNSEVPRFASNLGFNPLVPQKASSSNVDPHSSVPVDEEPIPEANNKEPNSFVPESVRDAHFDWSDSGLTNPLDAHSHSTLLDLELLANFDIHSPYYKEKRKSKKLKELDVTQLDYVQMDMSSSSSNNGLSIEAENILNNLPNLLVMEKQYIVFPIR